jgi:hypothetical protein
MINPWCELAYTKPFVLPQDMSMIQAFNAENLDRPDYVIRTDLLPEPFFGNVDAPVYVLILNPGYSADDDPWHAREDFTSAIRSAWNHSPLEFPLYYLDPRFADSPGAKWFAKKTRHLVADCGFYAVANRLFFAELFPYHSTRYRPIPKKISASGLVPSFTYTAFLVKRAIEQKKLIVIMRAGKAWATQVPELTGYDRVIQLNSSQNVSLSPGNMKRYAELRDLIREV